MIHRIHAIALHTFKEAVRDRILVMFVVFALMLMAFSEILSWLTVGSELKIVTDLGLAALALFGMMIAVFIGITLVHKEVEKRTVYAVLAKPVGRGEFLVGKYCGLMLTLGVVTGLMALFYLALVWWKGGEFPAFLMVAILLTYVELGVVTAIALVFSSFASPILAAIFTLGIYVVGHLSWALREAAFRVPSAVAGWLISALYYGLPDLETFNVRAQVVHGEAIGLAYFVEALLYGAAYSTAMIGLAILLFQRRDLT